MDLRLIITISSFILLLSHHAISSNPDQKDSVSSNTKNVKHPSYLSEQSILKNPGFEKLSSSWILGKHFGGSGLFFADSLSKLFGHYSAVVITENQNQKFQDVQLFTPLDIMEQTSYTISFKASVKKTCLISISIGNDIETTYEERFLLRPGVLEYGPFTFTNDTQDPFQFFAFNLGRTSQKIIFDDVVFIPVPEQNEQDNNMLAGISIH